MMKTGFQRVLGGVEVVTLILGAIIGWGWIVLAGEIVLDAGSIGAIIGFLIMAVIFSFIGLSYAELTAALPYAGGEHVYTKRALGTPISFICTWALLLTYIAVVVLQAIALPMAIEFLFPSFKFGYIWTIEGFEVYWSYVIIGVLAAIGITILNIRGIRFSATFQNFATFFIVVIGFVFAFGAFFYGGDAANLEPTFANGTTGVFAGMVVIPFLLVGFDVIPQAAEEINLPFRQIGKLIIITIFVAILWYIMVIYALGLSLPANQLNTALPVADAAALALGTSFGGQLLIFGGIAGILTSWNAFIIGGSRAIYAMSHSGMLPKVFSKIHPTWNTPYAALVLIGVVSVFAPFFGKPVLLYFVNAGSFTLMLAYFFVAISLVVLRKKEPNLARPYKVKHVKLVGILAAVLSIAIAILFLPTMPAALVANEWWILVAWFLLGLVMYSWAKWRYGKQ